MVAGVEAKWALPVGDEFNADLTGQWPLFWLSQGCRPGLEANDGWKSGTVPRVGTHPGTSSPLYE